MLNRDQTLVVILCMHRCGSSLTARLLHRLGMSLGPFDLGEVNESNRYGHFEAQPFVLLNREFQLRHFGFEGDLPDDAESFHRYCEADGRWASEETIADQDIARGRDLIVQLMRSGTVCGFKDPRTVQVWPLWRRVFASMSELRIIPLFVIRGPHEVAMSIFRRSASERDYWQALDIAAIHYRRMKGIQDQWRGPSCVLQFDPCSYGNQARHAAELCGLTWSEAVLAEVYDASCRHHAAVTIDHPAQAAFEALGGLRPSQSDMENLQQLLADAAERETMLRRSCEAKRAQRDEAHEKLLAIEQDIAALRQTADSAAGSQVECR